MCDDHLPPLPRGRRGPASRRSTLDLHPSLKSHFERNAQPPGRGVVHGPGNLFARRVNTPPGESVGGWTPDTDDETPRLVRLCGTRSGHLDPLRACSRQSGVGRRVVRGGQRCRLGHPVLEHQIWLPCLISCVGPWLCRGGTIRPRICGASSILTAVIHPRDRAGHRDPRDSGGFVAGTRWDA